MNAGRITPERLAEIKKICACVPFVESPAGVTETQQAFRDLIKEIERVRNPTLSKEETGPYKICIEEGDARIDGPTDLLCLWIGNEVIIAEQWCQRLNAAYAAGIANLRFATAERVVEAASKYRIHTAHIDPAHIGFTGRDLDAALSAHARLAKED